MKNDKNSSLCPSYAPKKGAQLYGIVNKHGFIDYLQSTLEVTNTFMDAASKGRELDKRFRFAGNCAKNGCNQWENSHKKCGLIDTIINIVDNDAAVDLQFCPIRDKCRWFAQRQKLACAQCNEIIRNIEMKIIEP